MKNEEKLETFTDKCAWCGAAIASDARGFPCFGKLQSTEQLLEQEGTFVWAIPKTSAKTVPVFVTTGDSQARQQGIDLILQCCSQKCLSELQEAFKPGFNLHGMVKHEVIGFGEPTLPEHGAN